MSLKIHYLQQKHITTETTDQQLHINRLEMSHTNLIFTAEQILQNGNYIVTLTFTFFIYVQ